VAAAIVAVLLVRPPSPESFGRPGSAWQPFVGFGLSGTSILAA